MSEPRTEPSGTRTWLRWRSVAVNAAVVLVIAVASIALSLWITPMQEVSAAGQTVRVGVTAPSLDPSGPGELDLFGQSIPTTIQFVGPVRPRLALTRITLSEQLSQLTANSPGDAAQDLEQALVRGWHRFFYWQIALAAVIAVVLFGAVAGWLRRGRRRTVVLIVVGVLVTEALNLGAIMITAYSAPGKLSNVRSLQDLVGGTPPPTSVQATRASPTSIRNVVVVGDSTAAGQGNSPLVGGTADDKACHRSQDSFAVDLASTDERTVTNLACSGATIRSGLLGPQDVGSRTELPQLDAPAVGRADVVIVSIGANDLHWADILRLCAVSSDCSNPAEEAYFQQQLSGFSSDYLQLISQLQLLPRHPFVVVNQYYDPFSGDVACLSGKGMTKDKKAALEVDLDAMNKILASGAEAAGFATAAPDFTGHGVCGDQPYVQGVDAPAPFHPTPSGELAIALAVERALHVQPPS